jgi:hypothetical protein
MGFKARRPKQRDDHECEYREAAARVRIEVSQLQAMHGRDIQVSSALVLDLLNPRGMWRFIDKQPVQQAAPDDDDVDPITGCKPVTARSGPDRVQDAVRAARGGPAPPPVQGYA